MQHFTRRRVRRALISACVVLSTLALTLTSLGLPVATTTTAAATTAAAAIATTTATASPLPSPPPLRAPTFCSDIPPHCGLGGTCAASAAPFLPVAPASIQIAAGGGCHWAKLSGVPNASLCTHRPETEMVSGMVHSRGSWLVPEELSAFVQSACSRERPFMLDVGSNIGSYAVVAATLGCHVVAFDPVMANLGRVVESVRRAGALSNATFYNNFVGSAHTHRRVQGANDGNRGGRSFLREAAAAEGGGGGAGAPAVAEGSVAFVVLDELFEWAGRPRSPATGRPFAPHEVGFIKVDAEGCDLEVLFGAQRLLQRSPVPFITIEFAGDGNCLHRCHGDRFVRFVYDLGYAFYVPYLAAAAPIPFEAAPSSGELWLVHRSAAALPRGWRNVSM